jgi:ribonuclease HII
VGRVEARQIDAGDILRASLEAMRRAVMALAPVPDVLLVDAVRVPGVAFPQIPVVHGDALSASIAAASVVAKVHRDRLLDDLARRHPAYGFESHKGYGTPEHWRALRLCGPSSEHRLTYRGVVPDEAAGAFGGRAASRRG